jgi:hypothetical protein
VRFTSPLGEVGEFVAADEVISSSQLVATLQVSYPESLGRWVVEVKNPQPGGGLSPTPGFFDITEGSFVENPFLISLSPDRITAGGTAFTLVVNGTNLKPGCWINFYSNPLPTAFVDSTQVTAEVPASLIKAAGKKPITVTNPDNGGTSNRLFISVE